MSAAQPEFSQTRPRGKQTSKPYSSTALNGRPIARRLTRHAHFLAFQQYYCAFNTGLMAAVLASGSEKKGLIRASTKASDSIALRFWPTGKPSCAILFAVEILLLMLTVFIIVILFLEMARVTPYGVTHLKTTTSRTV
jgi:hypothetical protein